MLENRFISILYIAEYPFLSLSTRKHINLKLQFLVLGKKTYSYRPRENSQLNRYMCSKSEDEQSVREIQWLQVVL